MEKQSTSSMGTFSSRTKGAWWRSKGGRMGCCHAKGQLEEEVCGQAVNNESLTVGEGAMKRKIGKRRRKPTLTKEIQKLAKRVDDINLSLGQVDFIFLCQQVKNCEEATNQMRNRLDGIEIAIARLIPKESLQFLPQFRNDKPKIRATQSGY